MKRNSSSGQSQSNEKPQTSVSENVPEKSSTEKKNLKLLKFIKP
ncbi:hypothetical protein LEP1GSC145_0666 [Leptospira interrogans serovar Djasiman str. LT1649]|uniref:Uncharacterized protein n=1 Tax=Leptospira interrogans str. 2002000626 TaxID=996803 RepID=A0A829D586_LEPIR|nr:hypothetical protein LEP1GSC117_2474 [Leptospira interrogans serovar Icterohaemorrhagiae str. Verdun LP]EMF73661.1 hypothetical protein LEP1GSC148_1538 [Leptospira interrogans serovar Canicola str. LT1962]EMM92352.1 hypothetical protein LEP1GSC145_0666 [Leptospira interrogans serovar Djasiman str. LT1649]EMY03336.1 hypothetical protein LEP1GSC029_4098 [Leptospira interrogans str. 2002000626]